MSYFGAVVLVMCNVASARLSFWDLGQYLKFGHFSFNPMTGTGVTVTWRPPALVFIITRLKIWWNERLMMHRHQMWV